MDLDSRVRSRLNPTVIEFKPYSHEELVRILRQRAAKGLRLAAWTDGILDKVAGLAYGDARIATQLLQKAAQLAHEERGDRIMPRHVAAASKQAGRETLSPRLSRLTEHHQLLYNLAPVRGGIRSDKLRRSYLTVCARRGIRPVAQRTHTKYLRRLIDAQLLVQQPALGRGNLRTIRRVPAQERG